MEWIEVEKQLPELTEPLMWYNDETEQMEVLIPNYQATVLAYDETLEIYKAKFDKRGWSEISSLSIKGGVKPTHWMPLPEPPKPSPNEASR
jgi:hypothetical protein